MGAGRRNQGDYAKSANERLLQVFTRDRAAIYCFVSQNNLKIEIIIKKKKRLKLYLVAAAFHMPNNWMLLFSLCVARARHGTASPVGATLNLSWIFYADHGNAILAAADPALCHLCR